MKKLFIIFIIFIGLTQASLVAAETSRISSFKATTDPVAANPSNYAKTFTFAYTAETGDPELSNFKVECDTSKSGSFLLAASKREFKCSYPKTPVVPYTVRLTPLASGSVAIGLPAQISVTESETPTTPPVNTEVKIKNIQNFDKSLGTLFNPLSDDMTSPGEIIVKITNIALMLVGTLAVIFIIIGGFLMVTSAGNENRLKQGKQTLIWAIAGLILSLLSFSIVAIVQSIIT